MRCSSCDALRGFERGFPSEQDFIRTSATVGRLTQAGDLRHVGPDCAETVFDHQIYECQRCGMLWRLSEPDQAYRGGLVAMRGEGSEPRT
jgi:hypothetical protein